MGGAPFAYSAPEDAPRPCRERKLIGNPRSSMDRAAFSRLAGSRFESWRGYMAPFPYPGKIYDPALSNNKEKKNGRLRAAHS